MPSKRALHFDSYSDMIKEIENLQKNGYQQTKNWNLGQISNHLSYYFKGALDGFPKLLPWIIRVTIGKLVLKKRLSGAVYEEGSQTVPKSVFSRTTEAEDKAAIEEVISLLKRLEANTSLLHPSSFFGELTYDQWEKLNLSHGAHHLGFLLPADRDK